MLEALYTACRSVIKTAMTEGCHGADDISEEQRMICKRSSLGHLMLVFSEIGIWPDAGASLYSLREIERKVRQMQPFTLPARKVHSACDDGIAAVKQAILAVFPRCLKPNALIPESLRDELRKRAGA